MTIANVDDLERGARSAIRRPTCGALSIGMTGCGTFRTWGYARLESVMRTKADVVRFQVYEFTP
jgi:hypothetical protein